MGARRRPRWSRRKAVRPSEITAAALALFVERGYAAARLDDIAARAGVSKGTLYLYFDGKEALFKAVVREGIVPALAEGEQFLACHRGAAAAALRELLRGWWRLMLATPLGGLPKLVIAEAQNFPAIAQFYYDEVIVRAHALMGAAIQRGIQRGEFRKAPVPSLVWLTISPFLMHVIWRHSLAGCEGRPRDEAEYIELCIDFVLRGLAAPRRRREA